MPTTASWYSAFLAELLSFPVGRHDDQVDALGLIGQMLATLVPGQRPAKKTEKDGQENIWQFMRQNWLSNRIFKSFDDIVDHCCYAWNTLIDQPWKIMSEALDRANASAIPSLHDTPPAPSKHLTRCLRNRVQARLCDLVIVLEIEHRSLYDDAESAFRRATMMQGAPVVGINLFSKLLGVAISWHTILECAPLRQKVGEEFFAFLVVVRQASAKSLKSLDHQKNQLRESQSQT